MQQIRFLSIFWMLILRANADISSLDLRDLPTRLTLMSMLLHLHNLSSLLLIEQVRDLEESKTANKIQQKWNQYKMLQAFRMLQKVAVVPHSID